MVNSKTNSERPIFNLFLGQDMMKHIDEYSGSACPIELFFDDTFLGVGTSFIWKQGDNHYLITNWHNVSGRDPFTGKHISKTAAEPNRIKVWFNAHQSVGARYREFIDLYDKDGHPIWYIHPKYGTGCDVVAIPLIDVNAQIKFYPINSLSQANLDISVGHDLFVLGYPFGISRMALPVWKRASLATEPELTSDEEPYVLLDTASRPGMSGSPIIRRGWGSVAMDDGSTATFSGGSATRVFGIYSGRLTTSDPLDAELGIAWPIELVPTIIESATQDTSNH